MRFYYLFENIDIGIIGYVLGFFLFWFVFLEPGYYKDNDFGIRIEDIAVIVPTKTKVAIVWLLTAM